MHAVAAVAALRAAGLTVIDGAGAVRAMKRSDPLPPFPPGGTHWSLYAAQRFAADLMDVLNAGGTGDYGSATPGAPRWDAPPEGVEPRDLADLLNLYTPPIDYPTAQADTICHDTPTGNRTKLVVVGGSFAGPLIRPIEECHLFSGVDYYFYYKTLLDGTGCTSAGGRHGLARHLRERHRTGGRAQPEQHQWHGSDHFWTMR